MAKPLAPSATLRPEPALLLLGTDHRCAPIELRERVAYKGDEGEELLVHLLARTEIAEALLLSTCNRTEIYLQPRDDEEAYRSALDLVFVKRAPEMELPGRLYVKRNGDAAHHLMAVASGLESMVLGEPEILGQVRQAAALAEAVGSDGPVLRRLLRSALSAGKRARQETGITSGEWVAAHRAACRNPMKKPNISPLRRMNWNSSLPTSRNIDSRMSGSERNSAVTISRRSKTSSMFLWIFFTIFGTRSTAVSWASISRTRMARTLFRFSSHRSRSSS